jgi:hypothetical protein
MSVLKDLIISILDTDSSDESCAEDITNLLQGKIYIYNDGTFSVRIQEEIIDTTHVVDVIDISHVMNSIAYERLRYRKNQLSDRVNNLERKRNGLTD